MASTSHIEIINRALENNVEFLRTILSKETRISVVIKGNAYGHGIDVMVPALEDLGIDHFSVYSSPEAQEALKARKKNSVIMIMGFIYDSDFEWIIKNNIEFYISDTYHLNKAIEVSKSLNKKALVHLDIETGMHRTGLSLKELKKAIPIIKENNESLVIKGVTSHFAGAESIANHTRIKKQFSIFKKRIKFLNENDIHPGIRHIASSAATINYPETRLDLVRTGIIVYGYWPTKETFIHYVHRRKDKIDPLDRALRWKSKVVSTQDVPEGEFIGYGLSYQAQYKMKIMVIPVGYCNGYSRSLSNNGHVLVRGQSAPVIGSVNMNMLICDITNIPKVKPGDNVVLIGKQEDNEISFASFAEMNKAMNYEILARLPENIERKLTPNGN